MYYASIFLFLSNLAIGQQISPQLDSIHKLKITNQEKTKRYLELLESQNKNKNYTQLGSDAHQIAMWIPKKPSKLKDAIYFVKIAIDARQKAIPFDPKLLRTSYNNLGYYNYHSGNYTAAIKAYKKVLSISGSNHRSGYAYHYIGKCNSSLEDPATAIENYKKAFKFFQKNKKALIANHKGIANAYMSMYNLNDVKKAITHLKIADSLIQSTPKINKKTSYKVHNSIASIYLENIKDTLLANKHYQKALRLAKELNKKTFIASTHYDLGLLNLKSNNAKALHHFKQCQLYAGKNKHYKKLGYFGLGLVNNEKHNYEDANRYYFQSISLFFNTEINSKNIDKKLTESQLSKNNNKIFLIEILKKVIDNLIDLGAHTGDNKYYQEAIKIIQIADQTIDIMLKSNISYNTKLLIRNLISSIYTDGIEICTRTNQIDYGFYLSEKNKAILLMQDISVKNNNISTTIIEKTTQLKQELIHLQDNYKIATTTKDSIYRLVLLKEEELEKYKDSISLTHPNYSFNKNIPEILPLSDITQNDDEIIIQYIMTEKLSTLFLNAYCLVLTKNHKKLYRLENSKTLQDKIYAIRKQLKIPFSSNDDIERYNKKAYELYTALIPEEVRPILKNKTVTIVTDYLLNKLPFESLVTDNTAGHYLIEDCEIRYAYSLSFEKHNAKRSRLAKKEFLGIAPVEFNNDLMKLTNSKKEIQNANLYYSGKTLTHKEATTENFTQLIDQYKIIHLATHANASDSISPWIAFSNKKLIASELSSLHNQAEMVVLSACNTSLGEIKNGEGVLSLARGFFKSGAKAVIPSLWSTNDKATATITSDFYKNLSLGQTKSAALRNAKLNYLNNNTDADASPHYWAPLVLIGDNSQLLPTTNYNWIWYILIGLLGLGLAGIFYKKTI